MGVTRERVRQIQFDAMAKLKQIMRENDLDRDDTI